MGLKIPIVAPKLMPITDVLCHERTAVLFDVLDMDQFKASISDLIDDPNRRFLMAENAYQMLIKNHTWEENAKIIVAQFNS